MKSPILFICNDFHLKVENRKQVVDAHTEIIHKANKLKVDTHIWAGDILDSRVSQRQVIFETLGEILNEYDKNGHTIYCIPGNHDKTEYDKEVSFLTAFKYHPSFNLIENFDTINIKGIDFTFIPFFTNEEWLKRYELVKEKSGYLISHIAISGSRNNNGTLVDSNLTPKLFKGFEKVFLGHYHNYQEINPNIYHLGSLLQNDFGEDEDKGVWMFDKDGNIELEKLNSKKYTKKEINITNLSQKQVESVIMDFVKENPDDFKRIKLVGTKEELSSFKKEKFKNLGVDFKSESIDKENNTDEEEIKTLTSDEIFSKFEKFCNDNNYEFEEGLTILKKTYGN